MANFRMWEGVREIRAEQWQEVSHEASPFHEYPFLAALEESSCVGEESGWTPLVFGIEDGDRLLAVMPAYMKTHSMGEFVYDWTFADSAHRAGLPYYPKMVITSPYSPISGPRILLAPHLDGMQADQLARDLLENAVDEARRRGCHSIHLLFCTERESEVACAMGFCERLAIQLHWENHAYRTFDDFLARFKSKRRKEIKRERRLLREAGIVVEHLCGADDAIPVERWRDAYRFYADTVSRFHWGRQYLNESFFEALFEKHNARIQFSVAKRDGLPIAGAFNLQKAGRRYGRYWGSDASVPFLHFEVCSYGPVEDAIARQLSAFEAGAGAHMHKFCRGFSPVATRSAHLYFHDGFHRAIEVYCAREAEQVLHELEGAASGMFIR